jgi:chromosome segregation ATPase
VVDLGGKSAFDPKIVPPSWAFVHDELVSRVKVLEDTHHTNYNKVSSLCHKLETRIHDNELLASRLKALEDNHYTHYNNVTAMYKQFESRSYDYESLARRVNTLEDVDLAYQNKVSSNCRQLEDRLVIAERSISQWEQQTRQLSSLSSSISEFPSASSLHAVLRSHQWLEKGPAGLDQRYTSLESRMMTFENDLEGRWRTYVGQQTGLVEERLKMAERRVDELCMRSHNWGDASIHRSYVEEQCGELRRLIDSKVNCLTMQFEDNFRNKLIELNLRIESNHDEIGRANSLLAEKLSKNCLDTLSQTCRELSNSFKTTQQDISMLQHNHRGLEGGLARLKEEFSQFKSQFMDLDYGLKHQQVIDNNHEDALKRVEQRGNIFLNRSTGQVSLLRHLHMVPRTLKDEPTAAFQDPFLAEAICKDLADVSNIFACPVFIEGYTKGGEGAFWQTLADSRARAIAELMMKFGAIPSLLRQRGLPGKFGRNEVKVEVYMDLQRNNKHGLVINKPRSPRESVPNSSYRRPHPLLHSDPNPILRSDLMDHMFSNSWPNLHRETEGFSAIESALPALGYR